MDFRSEISRGIRQIKLKWQSALLKVARIKPKVTFKLWCLDVN